MNPMERIEKIFLANLGNAQKREMPYDPRPSDVVVVGPPKTGTTWLQQILHQIRTKGDEDFQDIYKVTWWIPWKYVKYDADLNANQVANPRVYKSHDSFDMLPKCDGMKFVVIFRDPYDCWWSFIKFFLRFHGADEDMDESMALDLFGLFGAFGNDYFVNLTSWHAYRNDPNVLWIHYEDLKTDLRFCIEKIAQFIQVKLSEEELNRVHHFCTFEYMAKHDSWFSGDTMLNAMAKVIEADRWSTNMGMVRKDGGKVGEGRKRIGPKLKEAIDERWAATVGKELGYKDYEAFLKESSFLKRCGRELKN